MAKIDLEDLTEEEVLTLQKLIDAGIEVYPAPLEIESKEQLKDLGLTWDQCKEWDIMTEKVTVHVSPADKATADMLLKDLRNKYRRAYRVDRCKIPGKKKALIRCPECNSCKDCPYPQYRDNRQPDNISWDGLIDTGYEEAQENDDLHLAEIRSLLNSVSAEISSVNPKFTEAITLKEFYGYSVKEIAEIMGDTPRNIYFYIAKAKEIGEQYKLKNGITLD